MTLRWRLRPRTLRTVCVHVVMFIIVSRDRYGTCENFASAVRWALLLRSWKKAIPNERVHLRETGSPRISRARKKEMAHSAIRVSATLMPFSFAKTLYDVDVKERTLFTSDRAFPSW